MHEKFSELENMNYIVAINDHKTCWTNYNTKNRQIIYSTNWNNKNTNFM